MGRALKLSEALSIALHSMAYIAAVYEDTVTTRMIAERFGVSEAHLSKVLQRLVKTGLLTSVRGPRGGFSLAREADQILLMEVYESVEGPFDTVNCMFNVPLCDGVACVLGTTMAEANERLRRYLRETKVSDIARVVSLAKLPGELEPGAISG